MKLSGQRLRLSRYRAFVSSGCRYRNYPDKDYSSLVTVLAFLRDASIFGRFLLTLCIFTRHQVGFGTEHLKNDISECCYPGKRMRPDTPWRKPLFRCTYQRAKDVPVPQPFRFLHPVAHASGRVFRCWWDRRRCATGNMKTKQACILVQSCQQ
jgi:hypothetical protein